MTQALKIKKSLQSMFVSFSVGDQDLGTLNASLTIVNRKGVVKEWNLMIQTFTINLKESSLTVSEYSELMAEIGKKCEELKNTYDQDAESFAELIINQ